jgi:ATP-binding protein involved in chromosome partitioning
MTSLTKQFVTEALRAVPGARPGTDLVSGRHVLHVAACDGAAAVKLQYPASGPGDFERVGREAREAITAAAARDGVPLTSLTVEFADERGATVYPAMGPAPAGHTPIGGLRQPAGGRLPGVGRIIAVGAGKGGVGKSTIALNLAVGLARRGRAVGVLDGDIYGPSMPTMLGLEEMKPQIHDGLLQPFVAHGVRCMTMGRLVPSDKPLIWRGPMAHGAFTQLVEQTRWGELDDLIIDLPPGTGDVSLTMAQALHLCGAVVVCTPQKVAQDDAVRAAKMFEHLGIPVLGVVENMSFFVGDDGKEYDIFGRGGAEAMARRLGVPFLGAVPITMSLRRHSDEGNPSANFERTDSAGRRLAAALERLVDEVDAQARLAGARAAKAAPAIRIS